MRDRRAFLKTTSLGLMTLATPPLASRRAHAAGKQLTFLGAENVTGNWDPTANTTLANVLIEMQVFNRAVHFPMRPGTDSKTPEWQVIERQKTLSPFVAEYSLRKGLRFHDGKECVAEDVKASIEYATSPGRPRAMFPGKISCAVVNSLTLRVSAEQLGIPLNNALHFLHPYLCIMSARDIEAGTISKRMNGTGPFKFIGQQGDRTMLEANPAYFRGRPRLDRLVFAYVPDATTRVLALLSGEADMVERLEAEQYLTLQKNPKVRVIATKSIENKYLHFRCSKKPLDDVRVRRAIAHAIDRTEILKLMGAAAAPVANIVPSSKLGASELEDFPKFDAALCQKLLAEAGFPKGQGLPELEYITSTGFYPKTKEYGELIQAMLAQQGIHVKLVVLETAVWNERIYKPTEGHLVDVGWAATTPEPGTHLNIMWHNPPGLITGLNDPAVNAAVALEIANWDPELALDYIDLRGEGASPQEAQKQIQAKLSPLRSEMRSTGMPSVPVERITFSQRIFLRLLEIHDQIQKDASFEKGSKNFEKVKEMIERELSAA